VAQDSGGEDRELLVTVLSQLWHRIQVGRTEGDWSQCSANCGTGFWWGGQRVIGHSAQPIVAQDSGERTYGEGIGQSAKPIVAQDSGGRK
jgi:hypothetical protein